MKQNKTNKEMPYYSYTHNINLYQYHDTKPNLINIDWLLGLTPTKIAWVDWDTVCLPKAEGGLGVRRLREFNVALLGKWCWRMLVDKEGLWYRVLKARYGEEGAAEGGWE